jgi:hypothetical protein
MSTINENLILSFSLFSADLAARQFRTLQFCKADKDSARPENTRKHSVASHLFHVCRSPPPPPPPEKIYYFDEKRAKEVPEYKLDTYTRSKENIRLQKEIGEYDVE